MNALAPLEPRDGLGFDDQKFELGLTQKLARRDQPGSKLVACRWLGCPCTRAKKIVGRDTQNRADAHQGRKIRLARAGDIMAVTPLGEPRAPGDFGIGKPQIAGCVP